MQIKLTIGVGQAVDLLMIKHKISDNKKLTIDRFSNTSPLLREIIVLESPMYLLSF